MMKIAWKITITAMLFLLMAAINDVGKKLNKLIELNTPEFINVIPDKIIKE